MRFAIVGPASHHQSAHKCFASLRGPSPRQVGPPTPELALLSGALQGRRSLPKGARPLVCYCRTAFVSWSTMRYRPRSVRRCAPIAASGPRHPRRGAPAKSRRGASPAHLAVVVRACALPAGHIQREGGPTATLWSFASGAAWRALDEQPFPVPHRHALVLGCPRVGMALRRQAALVSAGSLARTGCEASTLASSLRISSGERDSTRKDTTRLFVAQGSEGMLGYTSSRVDSMHSDVIFVGIHLPSCEVVASEVDVPVGQLAGRRGRAR